MGVFFFGFAQTFFGPVPIQNLPVQGPVGIDQLRRALVSADFQRVVGFPQGLLALLKVPEEEVIGFDEPGFDEGFINQVVGRYLEAVADHVGKIVDPDIDRKGKFRKNRKEEGAEQELQDPRVKILPPSPEEKDRDHENCRNNVFAVREKFCSRLAPFADGAKKIQEATIKNAKENLYLY